jgi:signal transduction histidine kinase
VPVTLLRQLAWLWLAFCVVRVASATLYYVLDGGHTLWKPLLWESSSLLVVTLLAILQLRSRRLWRHLPDHPWRWFAAGLARLPLWCVAFLCATFGLRYAVYALAGEHYDPGPWPRVVVYESATLAVFYTLWLGVVFGLATRDNLLAEQRRAQDVEAALREAQLALLRQQLQPHFLFNALNLISATMYEDVARADTLLRKLASLLRQAAATTAQAEHPLADELALMRDYADIMAARFEGRAEVVWHFDGNWRMQPPLRVPSMIAQPLLENAFKYGVEPYATGCRIDIGVRADARQGLELTIAQNRGRLRVPSAGATGSHGIANVRKRLAAHYAGAATLALVELVPEGVCARLTLPCAS